MREITKYLAEAKAELSKVVWPKREETIRLTVVVFIVSAVVGLYVGGLDFLFTNLLKTILSN